MTRRWIKALLALTALSPTAAGAQEVRENVGVDARRDEGREQFRADREQRAGRDRPGGEDRRAKRGRADADRPRDDRPRSDRTRSRLDRRDDRLALSQFEERRAWNHGWIGDYRRFGVGVELQPSLFGRDYWIADPYAYRLPDAYEPYRWVRYYDDALLVDLRSGLVVDAEYGVFR